MQTKKVKLNINNVTLQEIADLFLKELFYGIPSIPVTFVDKDELDRGALGEFSLSERDGYDASKDELMQCPEYREKEIRLGGEFTIHHQPRDAAWTDPLNHPEAVIRISTEHHTLRHLMSTLLHELLHYYLWFIGHDHHDEDIEFCNECQRLGIPTNYDRTWNGHKWVHSYDYTLMDPYIEMYFTHILKNMLKQTA